MNRKTVLLALALMVLAVGLVIYQYPAECDVPRPNYPSYNAVTDVYDAPQGFLKYKELTMCNSGVATASITPTTGYWIHGIELKQVATAASASTTPLLFMIKPYWGDNDSTSICASWYTAAYATGGTSEYEDGGIGHSGYWWNAEQPRYIPLACTKFTIVRLAANISNLVYGPPGQPVLGAATISTNETAYGLAWMKMWATSATINDAWRIGLWMKDHP